MCTHMEPIPPRSRIISISLSLRFNGTIPFHCPPASKIQSPAPKLFHLLHHARILLPPQALDISHMHARHDEQMQLSGRRAVRESQIPL